YVDPAFAGLHPGDAPAGPAVSFGYDAFATIQDAIRVVAGGGTVHLAAGTYAENVTGDKLLTLRGDTGVASDVTIAPPVGDGITITASSVTLQDLQVVGAQTGIVATGVSALTLTDVRAISNQAEGFRGANLTGLLSISGSSFDDNVNHGIALDNVGDVVVTG